MPPQDTKMTKRTISLPERQITEMEKKVKIGEYPNFSEVSRAAFREFLERHPNQNPEAAACQAA
jgi:Arc/MetJ-type ribon-helix-helix transcriptional regulator